MHGGALLAARTARRSSLRERPPLCDLSSNEMAVPAESAGKRTVANDAVKQSPLCDRSNQVRSPPGQLIEEQQHLQQPSGDTTQGANGVLVHEQRCHSCLLHPCLLWGCDQIAAVAESPAKSTLAVAKRPLTLAEAIGLVQRELGLEEVRKLFYAHVQAASLQLDFRIALRRSACLWLTVLDFCAGDAGWDAARCGRAGTRAAQLGRGTLWDAEGSGGGALR